MLSSMRNGFYGWYVVFGSAFVVFGVAGGQFSFGVFLIPMEEHFGWSRGTLSLAFGVTFMISGLLRPVAGYIADHYSAKWASLVGVVIMGVMLLLVPTVTSLWHLYVIFAVMSIGITLGTGPILTKIVTQWFYSRRGLTLGLVGGAGSFGAMVLVPATSAILTLFAFQQAYLFMGILLVLIIFPVGAFLIRNRPEDMGLEPMGERPAPRAGGREGHDFTFREALGGTFFYKLTFGYFV